MSRAHAVVLLSTQFVPDQAMASLSCCCCRPFFPQLTMGPLCSRSGNNNNNNANNSGHNNVTGTIGTLVSWADSVDKG